ncbi:hypothetical protein HK102_005697, partial [Quaeritorhiza haematococci]
ILANARSKNRKVRVIGSLHSPSDISLSPDYIISISNLKSITSVNKETNRVTVQAGITLKELHKLLEEGWGLAVPNLGSISEQSVAGVISTGTHGTGIGFGILATAICDMTLITASGERLFLSPTSNPRYFAAALCSLGCLGIITQVTLQCVPSFHLHAAQKPLKFDEMMDKWEETVRSGDHVRFWWYPHTDDCIVWKGDRLSPAAATTNNAAANSEPSWFWDTFVGFHMYELSLYLTSFFPSLTPALNRLHFRTFMTQPKQVTDKSYKVFNFDCLFKQYVTEWAVEWKKAPEVLRRLKAFIEESSSGANKDVMARFYAHSPVEIRFVKRDDIWLSPAYGKEDVCFIGIIMYRPYGAEMPRREVYWEGFESIMSEFGGRPHWAKAFPLGPKELSQIYPKFQDFLQVRKELDPSGMFVNEYIARHLLGQGKGKTWGKPKL